MAKQKGLFKMIGTLDDVTFYKSQDGFVAKVKTEISKERIASDPAFARMRENGRDFGTAGAAGKTLRRAFQNVIIGSDSRMVSRLQKRMRQCLKADSTNVRGAKTMVAGNPLLLKGFEFNNRGEMASTLRVSATTTVNRITGVVDITVPAFVPNVSLSAPEGATHYKLIGAAAAVDFDAKTYTTCDVKRMLCTLGSSHCVFEGVRCRLCLDSSKQLVIDFSGID